jgi:hypothetical protein
LVYRTNKRTTSRAFSYNKSPFDLQMSKNFLK